MPAPHPSSSTASDSASSSTPSLAAATRATSHRTSAAARAHLSVDAVSLTYPNRRVLSNVSFTARDGDRLGIVGENGTGKSTLLRVIAGTQRPESGSVSLPGSVGLLEQQLPYTDDTSLQHVLDDAQHEALQMLAELELLAAALADRHSEEQAAERYAQALEQAEQSNVWEAESKRGAMLAGLGLGGIAASRPIGQLSGGQRLRLSLAALLLRAPHTLLLDEPSNHLDDASASYLERVLRDWPGIVLFASHDRALLDSVSTKILDLDPLPVAASELADASDEPLAADPGAGVGVRLWGVGYSAARSARAAEMQRWRERYAAELELRESLTHEIDVGSREVNRKRESKSESRITRKFYADKDARVTARRARNAQVRLEALERERVRRPPEPLRFRGFETSREMPQLPPESARADATDIAGPPTNGNSSRPPVVLTASRVALRARLAPTSLELRADGRLLLTGANGSGKSTLLAILARALLPDRGELVSETRIGYLPQEIEFEHGKRSAAETYERLVGSQIADRVSLEATGLLAARDTGRPVGELSVGQRRRIALAALVADPAPVLLLDEPTNHLSLTLVEELEQALQSYCGAVVIASHDRHLRSRWQGEVLDLGR